MMNLILYSRSSSLIANIQQSLQQSLLVRETLPETPEKDDLHLLHITSLGQEVLQWMPAAVASGLNVAVCSDRPDINEMLQCVQAGSKAYCNSYMQAGLYQQMITALANDQSWFPPQMLQQTFVLAQAALGVQKKPDLIAQLTARENEIAQAVADGLSNNQIAERFDISARTVKAHLTNIFKKLDIRDRVALVLRFK